MTEPLWTPSPERVERARLTAFRRRAEQRAGQRLPDYDALWRWSIDQPGTFWALVAEDADVRWRTPPSASLRHPTMPGAEWFPGGALSFTEHLLRGRGDRTAIVALDERGGPAERVSFEALRARVAAFEG
ncbi:MAG TPA: acetyl-coenzyme A synthetase N-terminal domain-containing protein, partial [Myxococcota bacterium]|nr:acetyl-coenzyme A synthetase N-terminal domain-containing protein [Myxococcota bacterium]